MKLGLFGNPVSHSKSPAIFASLGAELGRKISYEAVTVKGPLSGAIEKARAGGWKGANVTIPFKLAAAEEADALTAEARHVGAVNALRFGKKMLGHNTDADGLRDALRHAAISLKGKSVLIYGAGGAARAAGYACGREKAKSVRFVNRTKATASRLARLLSPLFTWTKFSAGVELDAQVWINATPLGQGASEASPILGDLRAPEAAVDLVYGKETPFQKQARKLGARTVDGTGMLVFQALRAWEFWDKPLGGRREDIARRIIKEIS